MLSQMITYFTSKMAADKYREDLKKGLSENKDILKAPRMIFILGTSG